MKNRRAAALMSGMMTAVFLTGCSGSLSDSQNAAAESQSVAVGGQSMETDVQVGKESAGEKGGNETVELEYWIAGDPRRTPVYEKSVEEFMKVNPDIKVKVVEEVGDNTQIQQKLMTMISSGSAPGVVQVDTMYVKDMAKAGTIVSMSGFDGADALAGEIFDGAQEPLVVDGEIYGYPVRANSIQLVYNKKMFREAGLDPEKPPKTFDELIDYAEKLTKRDANGNVLVYGYESGMTKDPHWTAHVFSPIFWSYGGEYQNDDGSAALNTEAAIKTMEYWKTLMVDLKVSPTERIEKGFQTEKVAMVHTGEWDILSLKQDYPDVEFGFATLPVAAESVTPIIPLGGRACVMPKGVKNQEAAWKLIQWVMNDEQQMIYTSSEVGLTPKKNLLNDPWFDGNIDYKHCLEDMQYVKAKDADNILQMNTFLNDAVQNIILNGADIKQSLDEANEKYNSVLNR